MESREPGSRTIEVFDSVAVLDSMQPAVGFDAESLIPVTVEETQRVPLRAVGIVHRIQTEYRLHNAVGRSHKALAEETARSQHETVGLEGYVTLIGRIDAQHTRPVAIGRENRVAEEVFASERTEASLQRTLCAYARDRGRQRRQQTHRNRGLRLQHAERIVAVQPDNRRQYHRITPLAEVADLGSQRLEVLLMVEDAGYVGRAHLARVLTYALQIWEVEPFGIYGMNSIIVSLSAAFLQVVVSILTAYAFSFLRFPFKKIAFLFVLAVLMMPTQVAIIPLYSIMTDLGWLDSYAGLIIPFAADAYGIFMIKQSMGGVPRDFTEAGQIEGLGHLRLAFQIMPHLVKPSLIAYIIMAIKWRWNDYFWVLIMTSSIEKRTLPVGIVMMKEVSDGGTQWHLLMAATLVVLMPMLILFLCLQKYFTNDYMSGAIKG